MKCPKDRKTPLQPEVLEDGPEVYRCPDCEGMWISAPDYRHWQRRQGNDGEPEPEPTAIAPLEEGEYEPPHYDTMAALCPECRHYLARVRIGMRPAFYLERCRQCEGIWCDRGEWPLLKRWGLHGAIDRLFAPAWQERFREWETRLQERQALLDKVGPELAQQIFDLADVLEQHPNGDFAVAFLMRRFGS